MRTPQNLKDINIADSILMDTITKDDLLDILSTIVYRPSILNQKIRYAASRHASLALALNGVQMKFDVPDMDYYKDESISQEGIEDINFAVMATENRINFVSSGNTSIKDWSDSFYQPSNHLTMNSEGFPRLNAYLQCSFIYIYDRESQKNSKTNIASPNSSEFSVEKYLKTGASYRDRAFLDLLETDNPKKMIQDLKNVCSTSDILANEFRIKRICSVLYKMNGDEELFNKTKSRIFDHIQGYLFFNRRPYSIVFERLGYDLSLSLLNETNYKDDFVSNLAVYLFKFINACVANKTEEAYCFSKELISYSRETLLNHRVRFPFFAKNFFRHIFTYGKILPKDKYIELVSDWTDLSCLVIEKYNQPPMKYLGFLFALTKEITSAICPDPEKY